MTFEKGFAFGFLSLWRLLIKSVILDSRSYWNGFSAQRCSSLRPVDVLTVACCCGCCCCCCCCGSADSTGPRTGPSATAVGPPRFIFGRWAIGGAHSSSHRCAGLMCLSVFSFSWRAIQPFETSNLRLSRGFVSNRGFFLRVGVRVCVRECVFVGIASRDSVSVTPFRTLQRRRHARQKRL